MIHHHFPILFHRDRSLLGVQTFPTIHEEEESKDDKEDGEITSSDGMMEDLGKHGSVSAPISQCCPLVVCFFHFGFVLPSTEYKREYILIIQKGAALAPTAFHFVYEFLSNFRYCSCYRKQNYLEMVLGLNSFGQFLFIFGFVFCADIFLIACMLVSVSGEPIEREKDEGKLNEQQMVETT